MIHLDGQRYGTAAEVAKALGVRPHVVRNWARPDRERLTAVRMPDAAGRPSVVYPLDQAAIIERDKRLSGRGRRRTLQPA